MAGENLSPRQQMIGMMYLVLLAMLAMNASKDLLNAFLKLEGGIDVTTENFALGNQTIYDKIEAAASLNSEKAKKINAITSQIQAKADSLYTLIAVHKKTLIEENGGIDDDGIPEAKDNQDVGAEYLMVRGHGEDLRKKITEFKDFLTSNINNQDTIVSNAVKKLLATEPYVDPEDVSHTWESGISEYLPLAAVTANLSNIQSYIRNSESQVINYLFEEIDVDATKVNKIEAATIARSSYVLQGDKYMADVFLAASDTTQKPIIVIGEYDTTLYNSSKAIKWLGATDTLPIVNGFGRMEMEATEIGQHTWKGFIYVPNQNHRSPNKYKIYPFENNYTIAKPSAVVSAEKMNVIYIGPENPISISVPGVPNDKVKPITDNGSLIPQGNGRYLAKATRTGKAVITVMAEMDGKMVNMGKMEFRVKRLPNPYGVIPMAKNNTIKVGQAKALTNIKAIYDPNFLFSLTCTVVSFDLEVISGDIEPSIHSNSKNLTPKMISRLRNIKRNDVITFKNIKVKDMSGMTITLPQPVTAKVKR